MNFKFFGILLLVSAPLMAAEPLPPPDSVPSEILANVEPITFAAPPVIKSSFARNEPFLEAELKYAYGGKLTTDAIWDRLFGGRTIAIPAGTLAYGIPMTPGTGGPPEMVWCAVAPDSGRTKWPTSCLINKTLLAVGSGSLMISSLFFQPGQARPYGGGGIVAAPFDLGAPIHVRYYVQNLGKITRLKGEIFVGEIKVNTWGVLWGDIMRPSSPPQKLMSIAGGILEIAPDPNNKDHYTTKILAPPRLGRSPQLFEIRNDAGAKQ